MALIRVENLCKNYGDLQVLRGITTEIQRGEVVAVIGPSGSGKSTFLRCLNLLETPTSGDIFFNENSILQADLNHIRQKITMVFQHFNLFANKNVLENLTLAPVQTKLCTPQEAKQRAFELLEKVGLADKASCFMPHKLSGGQKQRIAIARALAMKPEVILFDEPTSALDPEMIGEVLGIMREVASEGMTMIVVTHEMGFAKNVANRILFTDGGLVTVDAPPSEVFGGRCENARLNEFLNKVLNH